jgi:hypothetical protein
LDKNLYRYPCSQLNFLLLVDGSYENEAGIVPDRYLCRQLPYKYLCPLKYIWSALTVQLTYAVPPVVYVAEFCSNNGCSSENRVFFNSIQQSRCSSFKYTDHNNLLDSVPVLLLLLFERISYYQYKQTFFQ